MYTLLHTDAVDDTMLNEYREYCYSEEVLVRGRCTITCVPESVSQLVNGYQFEVLAEYPTKQEAEVAWDCYVKYQSLVPIEPSLPVESVPSTELDIPIELALPEKPLIKLQKIMKERLDNEPDNLVPWFGNNLKIVRENKGENDESEK